MTDTPTDPVRSWDDQGIGSVYTERAHLTALLAAQYPSVLVMGADPDAPNWPVLYVDLPTGQASWHVSPTDLSLFAHVRRETAPDGPVWDGHTNEQKYGRLALLAAAIARPTETHETVTDTLRTMAEATAQGRATADAVIEAHNAGGTDRG